MSDIAIAVKANPYKKFFPDTFVLETPRVVLRLLHPDDFDSFRQLTKEPDIWKYFSKNLIEDDELKKWISDALRDREAEIRTAFTIIDIDTKIIA